MKAIKSCVYTITNLINNKIYVGSTIIYYKDRCRAHLYYLRDNKHNNKHLQRAYNKYGKENFIFEVLEECSESICRYIEQYWINMLNSTNRNFGYNILSSTTNSRLNIKHSEESKKKMSQNSNLKHVWTKEIRELASLNAKKRFKENPEYYKYFGGKQSLETIEKAISKIRKPVLQYSLKDEFIKEYSSITLAAKLNNFNLGNIAKCCNNKRKTSDGYKWKFKKI